MICIEAQSTRWENATSPKEILDKILTEFDFVSSRGFREKAVWCHSSEYFDNKSVKISPNEAKAIDPAIRMGIECAAEVFDESSDYNSLTGQNFSVFFGISSQEYLGKLERSQEAPPKAFWGNGNNKSLAANRISYILNLTGSSVSVDVACASSTISLCLSASEVETGVCTKSIALGSLSISGEKIFDLYDAMNVLAKDGRCKTFDCKADGFGRSEACAAVILSKNPIGSRFIRLSSKAHSGSGRGLGSIQVRMVEGVFKMHLDFDSDKLDFFVPHGNGHPDLDCLELQALANAKQFKGLLVVSSFKHVLNHSEAASGLLNLIGFFEALSRGRFPGHPRLTEVHPKIGASTLESSNICIPVESIKVDCPFKKSFMLSSFAFGGAFAVLSFDFILQSSSDKIYPYLLVSAQSHDALAFVSAQYFGFLKEGRFLDVFFSSFVRQKRYKVKGVFFGADIRTIIESSTLLQTGTVQEVVQNDLLLISRHSNQIVLRPIQSFLLGHGIRTVSLTTDSAFFIKEQVQGRIVLFYGNPKVKTWTLMKQLAKKAYRLRNRNLGRDLSFLVLCSGRMNYSLSGADALGLRSLDSISMSLEKPIIADKTGSDLKPGDVFDACVRSVLGLGSKFILENDESLTDIGFDSFSSVELQKKITSQLQIRLPATAAYDYPTLGRLRSRVIELCSRGKVSWRDRKQTTSSKDTKAIGCSCRFGPAMQCADLSSCLRQGVDIVSEMPSKRWYWRSDTSFPKWGAFVEKIDQFDATFFKISPREAVNMDPQHRMLLECSWEAIESAAIDPTSVKEKHVSVFVGITSGDYAEILKENNDFFESGATGVAGSTAAGRVSYMLGVVGAALSIDTACSSSLVALVYGAKSVESGEEEMALCMGVQALCSPTLFLSFGRAGMLSPDGRCKTFDARANGYVRGEGCGAVLVARSGEKETGITIQGHAINQDGRSNGLTAPNGPSQVRLIRDAMGRASVAPESVQMLEAHGTGTALGDPIEMQAVAEAYGEGRKGNPLVAGSAKTNFGHTETAAGILGVLKMVLCMREGVMARHLHLQNLNEYIGTGLMEGMKCVVPQENIEWRRKEKGEIMMMGGVSSFGFSGTNSHIIFSFYGDDDAGVLRKTVSAVEVISLSESQVKVACHAMEAHVRLGGMSWIFERQLKGSSAATFRRLLTGHSVKAMMRAEPGNEIESSADGVVKVFAFNFERQSFWLETRSSTNEEVLLERRTQDLEMYRVEDHVVFGRPILPGAAHLSIAMTYARVSRLKHIEIFSPVVMSKDEGLKYTLFRRTMMWEAKTLGSDVVKARGLVEEEPDDEGKPKERVVHEIESAKKTSLEQIELFKEIDAIKFGPTFQWIKSAKRRKKEEAKISVVVCDIEAPQGFQASQSLRLPVELLDALFQTAGFFAEREKLFAGRFYAPHSVDSISVEGVYKMSQQSFVAIAKLVKKTASSLTVNVYAAPKDSEAGLHVAIEGFTVVLVDEGVFLKDTDCANKGLQYEVVWRAEQAMKQPEDARKVFAGVVSKDVQARQMMFQKLKRAKVPLIISVSSTIEDILKECKGEHVVIIHLVDSSVRHSFEFWKEVGTVLSRHKFSVVTVSRNAVQVKSDDRVCPWSRSGWAMARCAGQELGERLTNHILVDIQEEEEGHMKMLGAEVISSNMKHAEIALRGNKRYTCELAECRDELGQSYELSFKERGSLDMLMFKTSDDRILSEDSSICVRVFASGLNFRDVLNVMNMYPGDPGFMGLEFAGAVIEETKQGRRVFGLGSNCFSDRVSVRKEFVSDIPGTLTYEGAASLPLVFCTCVAVMDTGRDNTRDGTVLVHAAAGGIGTAAMQLARNVYGARHVMGTAGERRKKRFAQSWGADVVMSSRDTSYAESVLCATGGAGVNYVLNSLTGGSFVERTLACFAEEGHWSEIGKRGIMSHQDFATKRPKGTYHVYDLGDDMRDSPAKVKDMLDRVGRYVEEEKIEAVVGHVFPLRKAKEAFQFMFEGRHMGKIVFVHPRPSLQEYFDNGLVVITGAFGGLGKAYQKIQAGQLLLGRQGGEIAATAHEHAKVSACADISKSEDFSTVLSQSERASGLRTSMVLHLAGLTRDMMIVDMEWRTDVQEVLRPKVGGAQAVMRATRARKSVKCVMFSSVTSLLGNVGQSNYGAANGFLDGLAERNSSVVSINWGPWNAGMYERLDERLRDEMRTLKLDDAIPLLSNVYHAVAGSSQSIAMLDVEWEKAPRGFLTRELVSSSSGQQLLSQLSKQTVDEIFESSVREVLGLDEKDPIEDEAQLKDLGFDSMLSVDLRKILSSKLSINLPATLVLDFPTVGKLRSHIQSKVSPQVLEKIVNKDVADFGARVSILGCGLRFAAFRSIKDMFIYLQSPSVPDFELVGDFPVPVRADCEGFNLFDNYFFHILGPEARSMNGKDRALLECSFEAVEAAGIVDEKKTGVHFGVPSENTFGAAGRVSFFFGFTGKSETIDTACSSSLIAFENAWKNVSDKSEDFALCGGVNQVSLASTVYFHEMKVLSPSGRCRPFDSQADGYQRSEGCCVYAIGRASSSIEIEGIVSGHSGRSLSFGSPNSTEQSLMMKKVVEGKDIQYIEPQSAGTPMGDTAEISSLNTALERKSSFVLGSLKSVLSHTEVASGAFAILSSLYCMERGSLPKRINFSNLNELISPSLFHETKLVLPLEEVEVKQTTFLSLINSFGITGTNACMVVKINNQKLVRGKFPYPLRISARVEESLRSQKRELLEGLVENYAFGILSEQWRRPNLERSISVSPFCFRKELVDTLLEKSGSSTAIPLKKKQAQVLCGDVSRGKFLCSFEFKAIVASRFAPDFGKLSKIVRENLIQLTILSEFGITFDNAFGRGLGRSSLLLFQGRIRVEDIRPSSRKDESEQRFSSDNILILVSWGVQSFQNTYVRVVQKTGSIEKGLLALESLGCTRNKVQSFHRVQAQVPYQFVKKRM